MSEYDKIELSSFFRLASTSLAVLLFAGVLAAPSAFAQTQKGDVNGQSGGKMTDETASVAHAALAYELAQYGVDARDPMALVSAANILIRENVQPHEEAEVESEGDESHEAKDRPPVPQTPTDLLDAAEQMSGGDEAVSAAVSAARSMLEEGGDRGRINGPGSLNTIVNARSTDSVTLGSFRGGEYGRIEVRGDGDTDLDCFVYDEHNNLIDSDTDYTDICYLSFTPRWTGAFRLEVRNLGSVWNRYTVVTN